MRKNLKKIIKHPTNEWADGMEGEKVEKKNDSETGPKEMEKTKEFLFFFSISCFKFVCGNV